MHALLSASDYYNVEAETRYAVDAWRHRQRESHLHNLIWVERLTRVIPAQSHVIRDAWRAPIRCFHGQDRSGVSLILHIARNVFGCPRFERAPVNGRQWRGALTVGIDADSNRLHRSSVGDHPIRLHRPQRRKS